MTALLFLTAAIAAEVVATLSLRMAATGRRVWYVLVALGYTLAFVLLSFALGHGLGIGAAYGIWAAAGVAITSVASRILFGEPLTRMMTAGIALIVAGVLLIELGGA